MENNSNEEIKPSLEEQLEKSNSEAAKLIQELETKKSEYHDLLEDLNKQKEGIQSILSEINNTKQTFIDNIDKKLKEYSDKFIEVNSEIGTLKSDTEETFKTLDSEYNELINKYKTDANEKLEEMTSNVNEMTNKLNKENDEFEKFLLDNKTAYEQQYEKIKTLVSQYQASTTESLTSINARLDESTNNAANIKKMDAEMKAYKSSVDEYVNKMDATTEAIEERVKVYNERTQKIIEQNNEQTAEISRQLELATGAGLFAAFKKRKDELEIGQWVWLVILGVSIFIFIAFSCWLVVEFQKIDWNNVNWFVDIFLKITASTPILYLVAFVTDRYAKERRLLEEYAFKSTISLALKPYFDMVSSNQITDEERGFLIKSIENIFTTPTDKVYRTKECQNKVDIAHLTELTENVKNLENKINEGNK